MKRYNVQSLSCATCVLLLVACPVACPVAADERALIDGVAAVVNDRVVLVSDVEGLAAPAYRQLRLTYEGDELKAKSQEAYREALRIFAERQLILSSYENPNPAAVDMAVQSRLDEVVKEQFRGDRAVFLANLASRHMTLDDWKEEMRARILVSLIQQREVASRVVVSPGEIRREYDSNRGKYRLKERVKLRMIVLGKGSSDRHAELRRDQARGLHKRIMDGTEFSVLATSFSEGARASKGGDWGWISYDEIKPELAEAMSGLVTGATSDVIEMADAFYILKVEGRQAAAEIPLEEAWDGIKRMLEQQEYVRLYDEWIDGLRERSYVKMFE